tara:strand:+ start:348 stop:1163 length:816 start_codon:yes stop_codon:yes gene_type:complete
LSGKSTSLTEITASISAITLTVSILHEWAYFHVLDFHFLGFLSISDFFRIAIGWLPWILMGWLILGMNELVTQGIEKGMTEEEIVSSTSSPRFFRWFRKSPMMIFPPLFFSAGLASLLFMPKPDYYLIGIMVMIGWGWGANKIVRIDRIKERYTALGCSLIVVVPLMVAMVLSFGAGSAQRALSKEVGPYYLTFMGGKSESVQVLRTFELGVVIRIPTENTIYFYPWDGVAALEKKFAAEVDARSFVCRVFEVACLPSEAGENDRVLKKSK